MTLSERHPEDATSSFGQADVLIAHLNSGAALLEIMKRKIKKIPESELIEQYPIRCDVPGWFFRTFETSNNSWEIEGSDCWGRKFYSHGDDPDVLLEEAKIEARKISNEKNAS